MLAHVIDGSISARDASNVFDLVGADGPNRDAVLYELAGMGVRVVPEAPTPTEEAGSAPVSRIPRRGNGSATVASSASADDVAAARRVLRQDRMQSKPWKRILKAHEEVGLAALIRGLDVPLGQELPKGYRTSLDPRDERAEAFDALMLHNIRLVWSIAHTRVVDGLEPEDIAQHGMEGLRRAVEKFDATKGYKFSTYATWWIRQHIERGIENESRLIRLPVHVVDRINRVLRARDRLLTEYGSFTLPEMMRETGLSEAEVAECLRLALGTISLDKPIGEGGDTLGDFVLQPDDEADPGQIIDRMALKQLIRDALKELPDREALIISLRAGLDSDVPSTLEDVAKVLGLTRERIRQLEVKGRTKLVAALTERGLAPLRPTSTPSTDTPAEADQTAPESEEK